MSAPSAKYTDEKLVRVLLCLNCCLTTFSSWQHKNDLETECYRFNSATKNSQLVTPVGLPLLDSAPVCM